MSRFDAFASAPSHPSRCITQESPPSTAMNLFFLNRVRNKNINLDIVLARLLLLD
ncbi:hypothetical protein KR50_01530 [Jeotgalibacillus campisalis]|uniref:Uncharacterized protein n=1 Tax=Jeotgalibacillus campisalis TaxID=220754 RepID=A0A0C2SFW8_9BACL|nr:hypothetical protein KR50_01530 [Jeotgalibacillus campisalis]